MTIHKIEGGQAFMKSNKVLIFIGFFMFLGAQGYVAESLSSYQQTIETVFLREVANKNTFKQAVQTARLLGFLEYMSPDSFSRFHACISKYKNWDTLTAKGKQSALDACKAQGRNLAGEIAPVTPSISAVSPAANSIQERELRELRKEILDLRNMVEKLQTQVKNNHDRTLETLHQISQTPPTEERIPSEENF